MAGPGILCLRLVFAAATVVAATTATQFFIRRQAAQFNRLADLLGDGLLYLVQLLLRIQEFARHGILQQRVAVLLKVRDLFAGEGRGRLLFLLQRLALRDQAIVLRPGRLIRHKSVDALAEGFHARLIQNRLAEFPGFPGYRGFFNR